MEYVIGVILVIIVVVIVVLLFRKRLYDQIDYYEGWKVDIMGRNVAGKLTRVKKLSTEGEAREKLESWREEWDRILLRDLADVEELLIDAEYASDRFLIGSARKSVAKIESVLVDIEKRIDRIVTEVDRLIQTDESNREEMNRIEPEFEKLRKKLSNERNQFDRAAEQYEAQLAEIAEDIHIYQELVESGTYSEASSTVEKIKTRIAEIEQSMEDFPSLYKRCKFELPAQLDELYKNVQEMESDGYYLEHLHTKSSINDLQSRLLDYVAALEKTETEEVKALIPETEEQIEELYDQLEQEVIARNFVESKSVTFGQSIERFLTEFTETETEVNELKRTYHFEDDDLEEYMSLEKRITGLAKRHESFAKKLSKEHARTELRDDLTANIEELELLEGRHQAYRKKIATLRKDEIEAREQIKWMTESLSKAQRKLRLSNLPGIPNFILTLLEDATEKNERAIAVVEKQPLDILQLQKTLAEAKATVENALEQTDRVIEQAELTEIVIQYANRYRSRDSILAAKLLEAEEHFRKADYELALEQATEAIRERDPRALERIEEIHKKGSAS